jgi:hypothetical protein
MKHVGGHVGLEVEETLLKRHLQIEVSADAHHRFPEEFIFVHSHLAVFGYHV